MHVLYIIQLTPPGGSEAASCNKTYFCNKAWIFMLSRINKDYKYHHISSGWVLLPNELWKHFWCAGPLEFQNYRLHSLGEHPLGKSQTSILLQHSVGIFISQLLLGAAENGGGLDSRFRPPPTTLLLLVKRLGKWCLGRPPLKRGQLLHQPILCPFEAKTVVSHPGSS